MRVLLVCIVLTVFTFGCQHPTANGRIADQFDVQGHRGCRGHMPENTIPGFLAALLMGVTTLEMDVVITKDNQVILSHEPFMSRKICLDADGNKIPQSEEKNHNIYEMTYEQVQGYDCGSIRQTDFEVQKLMQVHKPLLSDMIRMVEGFTKAQGLPEVAYNIETKCTDIGDGVYHPVPGEFVSLLLQVINEQGISDRAIIQSFDPRTINAVHDQQPNIKTAFLVSNQLAYRHNLQRLDYTPTIFSPNNIFLTVGMIEFMHAEGIQVIPWTVNDVKKMESLIEMGVDGIITDYPDRLSELVDELELNR